MTRRGAREAAQRAHLLIRGGTDPIAARKRKANSREYGVLCHMPWLLRASRANWRGP